METEFQKPTFRPSQRVPEQAVFQAWSQASSVQTLGSANMAPSRIWSIVLNEVTITT